jgi:SAM-dependent methyltransferase
MANFVPLKNYMLYCLDRVIGQYGLVGPFLEIGCGRGDVSAHLARKGWHGLAIDFSAAAILQARATLAPFPEIVVRQQALSDLKGTWNTILLWDVLEHIEDDVDALRTIERLLNPGGRVLIAVPSNPREWRWDDDFYGHYRRYTVADLTARLTGAGLVAEDFWDFTYPVFWALRRAYTRLKRAPAVSDDKEASTRASATRNAWDLPFVSRGLDRTGALWQPLYWLQFRFFRGATAKGHEFFALARKPDERRASILSPPRAASTPPAAPAR